MNARRPVRHGIKAFAVLLLLFITFFSSAEQTGDTLSVVIHGTLKRKPCHINNDGIIAVEFGNVGINKVDGERYKQTIPYTLACEDPDETVSLNMTLKGTQTAYNSGAIETSVNGLGIEILQNGTPVAINQPFVIDYSNPPVLEAVPISSGATLTEGAFSATATLLAEYE